MPRNDAPDKSNRDCGAINTRGRESPPRTHPRPLQRWGVRIRSSPPGRGQGWVRLEVHGKGEGEGSADDLISTALPGRPDFNPASKTSTTCRAAYACETGGCVPWAMQSRKCSCTLPTPLAI